MISVLVVITVYLENYCVSSSDGIWSKRPVRLQFDDMRMP